MADSKGLPRFEGKQVIASRIAIVGAGDGLSDALDIEPVALKHGQEGFAVLSWKVRDVDHVPIKKGEDAVLARKHVLTTESVMIVGGEEDEATVRVMLASHADEVQRAKDSRAGQGRIDDEIPDDELSPEELAIRNKLRGVAKPPPE